MPEPIEATPAEDARVDRAKQLVDVVLDQLIDTFVERDEWVVKPSSAAGGKTRGTT